MSKFSKWGKKLVALTMVAAMATTVGCGKTTTSSNDSKKGSESEKATTAASSSSSDGAAVKIAIYRPSFNVASPDENEVAKVQDQINSYIKDKIGVQVELHDIGSGEYSDKTNLALASGEVNLFFTAGWEQTIKTDDVVKQNAVADISSKLKGSTLYKSIPESVWTTCQYSGKDYFVPIYKESGEGYNLQFRSDLVKKYGWDLTKVKSLKDIEPMLAQLKKDGLKYPYLSQKTAMFFRYYIDNYDFFSQDSFLAVDRNANEVVDPVIAKDYSDFATLMGGWAQKGYLSDDDLTKTTTDTTVQTQDWGISWWTDVPNNAEASTREKQDVQMAHITSNWVNSNTNLGSCYAISAKSNDKQVDAAIKFLGLLYTDKTLADLYTFGIEGTDYTKDSNGAVTKSDKGLYNHSSWESAPVSVVSLESSEPSNKVDLYKTFNAASKVSTSAGFRFDTSSIDAKYAACQQVFNQYGYALENGGYAPADVAGAIKDYQSALDAAGYQDVLKAAQKQYDDWKAIKK